MRREVPVRPVIFALICVGLGALTTLIVYRSAPVAVLFTLLAAVVPGTFVSAWLLWSWAYDWIEFRSRVAGEIGGRIAGGITGVGACLFSQYTSSYLWLTGNWAAQALGIQVEIASDPVVALVGAAFAALLITLISGVFTIPAGFVAGALCSVQKKWPRDSRTSNP